MAFNPKLLVPLALGVSILTVSAFVVYYVYKEEEINEKTIKSTKINKIEVQVQKSLVPALIGRNGSNIKQIEEKSGAMIHFKKFSDKDYDVCIIRGKSNTTQVAETMIHEFIRKQPLIVEDRIEVPSWAVGRIIGTGGDNINDISHRSGARVKIEGQRGDSSNQRLISFRGTAEQIQEAKKLIEGHVEQERCRREIEQSKRSPRVALPPPPPPPPPPPEAADTGDQPHVSKHVKHKAPESNGSSIEVYVSAVSSPSRFWVQFVGPQVAQLDDLVAHMTDYYGNRDNRATHALKRVSVGQVVAAVFRHDGRWYRARVDDIRPNEFDATQQVADVFYLDYGDSEYVATHELCELRADLLRLRFQAMECFLAGVKPAGKEEASAGPAVWPKWQPQAVERFEELTQVARWKPLVSRTYTYKKTAIAGGEKEKEIPGIKLYDNSESGTIDIAATLVEEGWAELSEALPPVQPHTPFGDLNNSRVLGMIDSGRASSLPKDHRDAGGHLTYTPDAIKVNPSVSKSMSAGLDNTVGQLVKSVANFDITIPEDNKLTLNINGSRDLIASESKLEGGSTLDMDAAGMAVPKTPLDELKANMNRIDSHHSSLEALGRQY